MNRLLVLAKDGFATGLKQILDDGFQLILFIL